MAARLAGFRSDEARDRFYALYDQAVADLWPLPAEELDVPTRFGTTRVRRCGTGGRHPVLLVPGHAGTSVGFATSVEPLARHHQVLAVDVVGTLGRSVQTRPFGGPADLAPWLCDLLDGLGVERAHLVGYSEGGYVAFHAASGAQDRVVSLVAIDAAGTVEGVRPRFLAAMVWAGLKVAVGVTGAMRAFGERLTPGVSFPDQWWELVTTGARSFRHTLPMPRRLTDEQLQALGTPTLLYMAGSSEVYDADKAAARARALLPHAEVVVVAGAQHGVPFTHPERTWADVLAFLDRHDDTEP